MRVAALVLAAGRGERLGASIPKAFLPLAGRPLVACALEALAVEAKQAGCQGIVVAGEVLRKKVAEG